MALRESRPILTLVVVFFAFIAAAEAQTIWYVDAANCPGPGNGSQGNPFCKIQTAITAAAANATPPDEIVVADGIYTGTGNKNLDFAGKTIKLRSANGAANCIIDCENSGRGFYFHSGETAAAGVDGFTIRNGKAIASGPGGATGAGIHCNGARPTLSNCIITGNSGSGNGGGVYGTSASLALINCTISGNVAYNGSGVYLVSGSPTLTNCTITGNNAGNAGGGILCGSTSATLTNCTITGNSADDGGGGGVYFSGSSANLTVTDCTISENTAYFGGGGGICCDSSSSPALTNCAISGNTAYYGGGVYSRSSAKPRLSSCTIAGNIARDGGGVYCDSSASPTLANCAISGNTSDEYGGGVYCTGSGTNPTLTDCIISENTFSSSAYFRYGGGMCCESSSSPTLSNCTISGNTASGNSSGDGGGLCFRSSAKPKLTSCTISENTASRYGPGVYCTGSGTNPTLKDCIISGNVLSSSGSYAFGGGICCDSAASPTLSNCDISGNTASSSSGFAYGGGVFCTGSGTNPMLTDCIISENSLSSSISYAAGGGIYCFSAASPTMSNCTISGNTASSSSGLAYGGGVFFAGNGTNPMLTGCTISENTASSSTASSTVRGGGMCVLSASRPILTNCTISENTASSLSSAAYGGGVYSSDSNTRLTLAGCTISGNTVSSSAASSYVYGGGTCCDYYSSATFSNCTLSGNKTGGSGVGYGGGMCFLSSDHTLINCTISGNIAGGGSTSGYGGGVYCSGASPTLTNCILWGDAPQEVYRASGTTTVTYCDVQGGYTGYGNINADPRFAFSGDFHLLRGSPCIDAGTNSPSGGLPPTDADGTPRPLDGNGDGLAKADMGAFEFDPAAPAMVLSPTTIEAFAYLGGPTAEPQTLLISNSGGGVVTWQVETECPWVTVDPAGGSCQHEVDSVAVSFDTAGFAVGDYTCSLSVSAAPGTSGSRSVPVVLHVRTALHVPSNYPTIQAAIDAAAAFDWVIVADGVYTGTGNKDLDFHGKSVRLHSASGSANCIIDCQSSGGRGFYFHSSETPQALVDGFTIRNGSVAEYSPGGPKGGGVFIFSASPTLRNCVIEKNSVPGGLIGGPPLGLGGGVYCHASGSTLDNCTIRGNIGYGPISMGGGISCSGNNILTLTRCAIEGNTIASDGGGIDCWNSSITLTECAISGNNVTAADFSGSGGGGLALYSAQTWLTDCIISGNSATGANGEYASHGGGVFCSLSSATFTNCTITRNILNPTGSSLYGGGMYCADSSPVLTNCILWGDTPSEIYRTGTGNPVVTYSNIQGGYAGTGNINADPLFVDAANGNFRLAANSPCIDVGNNAAIPAGITTDLDGLPRIMRSGPLHVILPHPGQPGPPPPPPVVDMGAYEFRLAPLPEPEAIPIGSPIAKPSGREVAGKAPKR